MSANTKHFDTIVIGAGISGLACAARLYQHRARAGSVLVLEARDRIGGRIDALYVDGSRLDLGANWIHGIGTAEKPNPLMDILPHKRYKQLSGMVSFRPPKEPIDGVEQPGDWQHVLKEAAKQSTASETDLAIPAETAQVMQQAMWGSIEGMHEAAANMSPAQAKQTIVLSALQKSEALKNAFDKVHPEYDDAMGGMIQFIESMEAAPIAAQSAEHRLDMAGMSLLEFAIEDFDGDQVFLQDGYIAIVKEISKDLTDAGLIELNVDVQHIEWKSNPITITTTAGQTYTANQVVCTLPLGVLQHGKTASDLFRPSLPKDKTQAIASLGFGTLDKIFMVYENAWWTVEPYWSILRKGNSRRLHRNASQQTSKEKQSDEPDSFSGFTHELPGIHIDKDGNVSSGPRNLTMTNLHSLSGFPVLCAFVSCANAVHIEGMSDADAGGIIHRTLTNMFGREPPQPHKVHVTRWAADPYSLGSYSHMITDLSETQHREVFQKPIVNSKGAALRFAGEHTSRNHFATAHGALLSGWREADNILESAA